MGEKRQLLVQTLPGLRAFLQTDEDLATLTVNASAVRGLNRVFTTTLFQILQSLAYFNSTSMPSASQHCQSGLVRAWFPLAKDAPMADVICQQGYVADVQGTARALLQGIDTRFLASQYLKQQLTEW